LPTNDLIIAQCYNENMAVDWKAVAMVITGIASYYLWEEQKKREAKWANEAKTAKQLQRRGQSQVESSEQLV